MGLLGLLTLTASCTPPAPPPLTENTFAFGVYGDGPYFFWEHGRHRRLLADASATDLDWLLHVGDILWAPCSDEVMHDRLKHMNSADLPVIYTPGDNEWTDCHEERPGEYDPLERLDAVRRIFFADPESSLGARPMSLLSQASVDPDGLPENAMWRRGGFVFATVHMVGSYNGMIPFPGREERHDEEVRRRTEAAIRWLERVFEAAAGGAAVEGDVAAEGDAAEGDPAAPAHGVVIATHANVDLETGDIGGPYESFVSALEGHVDGFAGRVLFIHGDSHVQRVDRPLRDADGNVHHHFVRLETYGSPDIGWVRVVVDSVAGRFVEFEPRLMRGF